MHIYKTIEAYKQAWMILREMNLEWILGGVKPETMELPLTKIIDGLLVEGKLVNLMQAITQSNYYVPSVSRFGVINYLKRTRWEKTDINLITQVATDFFVGMLPMFSILGMLGDVRAAGKPDNQSQENANSSEQTTT